MQINKIIEKLINIKANQTFKSEEKREEKVLKKLEENFILIKFIAFFLRILF